MNTKTVKEKVEKIITNPILHNHSTLYDAEIIIKETVNKIDKLYRKEFVSINKTNRSQEIRERLMQQFLKENPMILDDDISDRFEDWLGEKQANIER